MLAVAVHQVSRREQLRLRTIDEILHRALELVDARGVNSVTIAALGRSMGMTAPALYRYFSSREAVVEALVVAAYIDLGSTIELVVEGVGAPDAAERVGLMARAYLRWARAHPRRYTMLFSDRASSTELDLEEGLEAVTRGMRRLLETLGDIASMSAPQPSTPLAASLRRWNTAISGPKDLTPLAVELGVLMWTRLHGLATLEISGALEIMGLDVEKLLSVEIASIVRAGEN